MSFILGVNRVTRIKDKIQYERYNWNICRDFMATVLLLYLQLVYTKFCCFRCEWDSMDRKYHYVQKHRPKLELLTPGQKNVAYTPLIKPENFYLHPLHIKFGIMKILSIQWIKTTLGLGF